MLPDGWTAETVDGSRSAHYEDTVAITYGDPWSPTPPTSARMSALSGNSRPSSDRLRRLSGHQPEEGHRLAVLVARLLAGADDLQPARAKQIQRDGALVVAPIHRRAEPVVAVVLDDARIRARPCRGHQEPSRAQPARDLLEERGVLVTRQVKDREERDRGVEAGILEILGCHVAVHERGGRHVAPGQRHLALGDVNAGHLEPRSQPPGNGDASGASQVENAGASR